MLNNQDIKLIKLKFLFYQHMVSNFAPSVWYDIADETRIICLESGKPTIKNVSERFLLECHEGQVTVELIEECIILACQHTLSNNLLDPLDYKEIVTATTKERIFKGEASNFIGQSSVNYGFSLSGVPEQTIFLLPFPEFFGIYAETEDRTKFGLIIFLDGIKKFTVS